MHSLTASFVLGYHGCDEETAEKLLNRQPFIESKNAYDWLGAGIYFWEANPDRALVWAEGLAAKKAKNGLIVAPAVVGAAIDLGFCLDLITANGITALKKSYEDLVLAFADIGAVPPVNSGGNDLGARNLDCAVINYHHATRRREGLSEFDSVRGVFTEGDPIYPGAGFRQKTHIQICIKNHAMIKGVFRVPKGHFSNL
ncbi:hypothetical protein [Granulicella sibirica]|uniref:hypothetical protein n=1 Tax=Granulicella sibirica TaxID=2479048 RepID=UPI0010091C5A|nr:hypothetical protein [Granulicella sibirica]